MYIIFDPFTNIASPDFTGFGARNRAIKEAQNYNNDVVVICYNEGRRKEVTEVMIVHNR